MTLDKALPSLGSMVFISGKCRVGLDAQEASVHFWQSCLSDAGVNFGGLKRGCLPKKATWKLPPAWLSPSVLLPQEFTCVSLCSPAYTDLYLPCQGQLQQLTKVLAQRAQGLTHAGLHGLQDVLILNLEAPREKKPGGGTLEGTCGWSRTTAGTRSGPGMWKEWTRGKTAAPREPETEYATPGSSSGPLVGREVLA